MPGLRAFRIVAVGSLEPMPGMGGVVAHAEAQAVFARHLGPGADNVLLWADIERVPGMMLGIVVVKIVVVVRQRDEVLRSRPDVKPHQFFRLPLVRLPEVVQFHEPELRRMPVGANMVIVLAVALDIHLARIPITLLRHALGRPMRPHPKLGVAEPRRTTILARQRFPTRLKQPGHRFSRSGSTE